MKLLPILLLLTSSLPAQNTVFGGDPNFAWKAPAISQKRLDAITSKWLVRLRLTDWDVRAIAVALEDLPEGALGTTHFTAPTRVAKIRVLRPEDYARVAELNGTVLKKGKEILRDIEDTVVHELVHLRLRDLMTSEENLRATEEVTVNRLTAALLNTKAGR